MISMTTIKYNWYGMEIFLILYELEVAQRSKFDRYSLNF
jgi:hypothetical protein